MYLAALVGCRHRNLPPDIPPDAVRAQEIRTAFISGGGVVGETNGAGNGAVPTGWAALTGVFKFDGAPPPREAVLVSRDVTVCAPGGQAPMSESLVVGPNGGIKDVVIFLNQNIAPEEPWTHASMTPGKTEEIVFDQKQCIFLSHVLAMQASQPLKIVNSDPVGHNTKLEPKSNPPFNQNIGGGGSFVHQLSNEEKAPIPVSCSVHPWMNAFIVVRDNSYVAVSAEDGAFEIPNLPAGVELEFRVWQASANFVQDVQVNGADQKWSRGRFAMTLDPQDESKNRLDVTIKSTAF
jgi:hypothetical protein